MMSHISDKQENEEPHPWQTFLEARAKAILWMSKNNNLDDYNIANLLSMDEQQVYLIRIYKQEFGGK